MTMFRLIYTSRPFGFDQATLGGILIGARRNNARDGVTGALICRADLYLQLLEGPRPAVEAAFARIDRDDRHVDVERLTADDVTDRMFPAWDMLDDPARSWLWSAAEVAAGAVAAASPADLRGVFERLAADRDFAAIAPRATAVSEPCPASAIA